MDPAPDSSEDQRWTALADAFAATLGPATTRIDTHISRVLLTEAQAYKLKKPVRFAYLDFSTRTCRRAACQAEIDLNRRTAPDLYIGLETIADLQGKISFGGPDGPGEPVVVMRRFDEARLFDRLAARGDLSESVLMQLVARIEAFHRAAAPVLCDYPARMDRVARDILAELADCAGTYPADLNQAAMDALTAALDAAPADLAARAGAVRRCHGDLHLGNVFLDPDGEPVPFDCIEFSDSLAGIDPLYDSAFLIMDLDRRAGRDLACQVRDRYLALSGAGDDPAALRLLPFYLTLRAGVRAHVSAAAGRPAEGPDYLRLMIDYATAAPPRLIAIGGLSGSGKSRLARHLAPGLGRAPGALVLRSDVIRKLMGGVAPETRLPPDAYSPAATQAVYARLGQLARIGLDAGWTVIADAVFARPAERAAIAAAAGAHPFTGLWLDPPEAVRLARVAGRIGDASDADLAVAQAQRAYDLGPMDWQVLRGESADLSARLHRAWRLAGCGKKPPGGSLAPRQGGEG